MRLRESASYRKDSGTVLVPGSDVLQELAGHDRSPRIRVLLLVNQQHPLHALLNPEAVVVTTEDVLRKITGLRSVGGTPFPVLPTPLFTCSCLSSPSSLCLAVSGLLSKFLPTSLTLLGNYAAVPIQASPFTGAT